jgi:hypothetical protein
VRPPFEWDHYSDQPKVILDKAYKRRMRAKHWPDYLKMAATSALVLPAAMAHMAITKPVATKRELRDIVGMGVNLDKGPEQFDLIDELGIKHVLIRMPLWDMDSLKAYQSFAKEFYNRGKTVLINVLQDREHIENHTLLASDMHKVFDAFGSISHEYQIGNAINRVKWGFFAVEEYLTFFKTVHNLRNQYYPELKLLGPAVIDFEYHFTARALFNAYSVQFDRLSALLYVDRMGAPENKQYGLFDTDRKIRLLASLAKLSPKVKHKGLYITEVNWPLVGTAPYAPTSEKECVSAEAYSNYMQRYLRIALSNGCVSRIYWHQLIAPGYGLVDVRDNSRKKLTSFDSLTCGLRDDYLSNASVSLHCLLDGETTNLKRRM